MLYERLVLKDHRVQSISKCLHNQFEYFINNLLKSIPKIIAKVGIILSRFTIFKLNTVFNPWTSKFS